MNRSLIGPQEAGNIWVKKQHCKGLQKTEPPPSSFPPFLPFFLPPFVLTGDDDQLLFFPWARPSYVRL